MSTSAATETVKPIVRDAPSTHRNGVADVSLRRFPYPYRAAMAICSDIDETRDVDEFLDIQRFLNTTEPTSMGRGVGLDIGNSFYFQDDRKEFSYFDHDERTQRVIVDLIHAGYIDCLHSYGDAANSRDDALRALDVLDREACRLDVWVNHFGSRSNFGRKFEYMFKTCHGDDPQSEIYHADATLAYGIRYIWIGAMARLVGQSPGGRCRMLSVADSRRPVFSTLNVLKETRKKILGMCKDERYLLRRDNELMQPMQLGDGQRVHEFIRYCNHPLGMGLGATSRGLAYVISSRVLRHLKQSQGVAIVYTHLGKNSDCQQPVAPETQEALRGLEREYRDGEIYVATTSALLNYERARQYLNWTWQVDGDRARIHIRRIDDPIFPQDQPAAADLRGLTFYVPSAADAEVFADATQLHDLRQNPPDATGRPSVTIPTRTLQFPL